MMHIHNMYPYYGAYRMVVMLEEEGITISVQTCRKHMRKLGISQPSNKNTDADYSSYSDEAAKCANHLDLVQRRFKTKEDGTLYYQDVTEFKLGYGEKLYLSLIVEANSSCIVSSSLCRSDEIGLVLQPMKALAPFLRQDLPIIWHSDNGKQYYSKLYRQFMKDYRGVISMSKKGCSPANGAAESKIGKIKDLVGNCKHMSMDELMAEISAAILFKNMGDIKIKSTYSKTQVDPRERILDVEAVVTDKLTSGLIDEIGCAVNQ